MTSAAQVVSYPPTMSDKPEPAPYPQAAPYQQPYAPPPAPYPQGYQPPPTVIMGQPQFVVVQQPPTAFPPSTSVDWRMQETPCQVTCQYCNQQMTTRTVYTSGALTWLACIGIAFIGCILGCCLIPFCIDGCKDVEHHCSGCGRTVGIKRRL